MDTKQVIILRVKDTVRRMNESLPPTLKKLEKGEIICEFGLKGGSAGRGGYRHQVKKGILKFNIHLAKKYPDKLFNTIDHEVAHVFQIKNFPSSRAHGREWAYFCGLIGHVPAVYHTMDVRSTKSIEI